MQKTLVVVACLVLSLFASTASAFTRGSTNGNFWIEGTSVHYINVYTNENKGLVFVTTDPTTDGCGTFYIPYDHLGFSAALAILTTAKAAKIRINLEHRSEKPPWNPYACRVTSVGLSAAP